jgi:Ca-activated chloride channel family protein
MFLQSVEQQSFFGAVRALISRAIILASKAMSGVGIMILISDGENYDSKIKEAVNVAKKQI